MSYAIGATTASLNDGCYGISGIETEGNSVYRTRPKVDIGAGTVLTAKYRAASVATAVEFAFRSLEVIPIRVG